MGKLWYQWLHDKLPCGKNNYPDTRTVYVGNRPPPEGDTTPKVKYPDNKIVSSRYTILNFLPKNMFEQFHRIANFYFLCVALISVVIDGPVSPWTSIVPLIFVVVVTAVKQGYEDILRHRADKEVNLRQTIIINEHGEEVEVKSQDLRVGNIVKVKVNDPIPCDMVLLSSDDVDGECAITTANLDGETNLKTFNAISETKHLQSDSSFQTVDAVIECQQPIIDLYRFVGRVNLKVDGEKKTQSLNAQNVLLRGCRLRNTPYIYGCAIYTGQDTKISLNSSFKSAKFSRVEKRMNLYLVIFLVILLVYSAIWTGIKYWYYSRPEHSKSNYWYIRPYEKEATFGLVIGDYLSFMVLCNYVIPISMYVTIELMKFGGKLFFEWDLEMYDPITDEPAKANTSDINEELGQIEFLFTDKTGTLTENMMKFRQCSVGGVKYEERESDGKLCVKPKDPNAEPVPLPMLKADVKELLQLLALCHTIRVDRLPPLKAGEYSEDGSQYDYQASSPDEKALVEAAARSGVVYHGVKEEKHELAIDGTMHYFTVKHVLDFDPTRKRMSVIVQDSNGKHYLLVKGAETAILDRCLSGDVRTTEKHICDYAVLGLRTLCIAQKKLSDEEFQKCDRLLTTARNSLDDREEMLSAAFEEIERDLDLLGATAVEDKLQDGVPETLISLRTAGIQVWVLTGDKEETAVNISYSAGHFNDKMTEIRLTKQTTEEAVARTLDQLKSLVDKEDEGIQYALICDGQSLRYALSEEHKETLRHICFKVVTVLCCRMSPLQKAEVVRLIKTSKNKPTTAAIGDGANDVSMIQEAHVGLGIMGKEGRQAVRCSDYAFSRFRFLQRAVLVHGHYFYWRICTLVQYFFYKNVAMITAQLFYTFFSAYSAQSIFETVFLTFYNVTMAGALPVLIIGLYEKPMPAEQIIAYPRSYQRIAKNRRMTMLEFGKWNGLGLYHSAVFFFGCYFAFAPSQAFGSDGKLYNGVFEFGTTIITTCIIVVNLKLMLETYLWNVLVIVGFIVTFLGVPAIVFLYSEALWSIFASEAHIVGLPQAVWGSGYIWLLMLLLTMTALLPDFLIRAYTDNFDPMFRRKREKKLGVCENTEGNLSTISNNNLGAVANGKSNVLSPNGKLDHAYTNPALVDEYEMVTDENIGRKTSEYQSSSKTEPATTSFAEKVSKQVSDNKGNTKATPVTPVSESQTSQHLLSKLTVHSPATSVYELDDNGPTLHVPTYENEAFSHAPEAGSLRD